MVLRGIPPWGAFLPFAVNLFIFPLSQAGSEHEAEPSDKGKKCGPTIVSSVNSDLLGATGGREELIFSPLKIKY